MNRFLKTNQLWLSLLGMAIFIVILTYLFRPKSPDYRIDSNQSLNLLQNESKRVTLQKIVGKQLVDLRSADDYKEGHPLQAINIPIRQLMEKQSLEWLKDQEKSGKEVVLCGKNELQATSPWLLLQQLGYNHVLLFQGGISSNGDLIETTIAESEVSVVDATLLHTPSEITKPAITLPETRKSESVVPVRKASSTGGGC